MKLTKKTNPDGTITLSWEKIAGVDGYRFYSAGVFRSDTWDANRTSIKFSAGQEPYVVEAIVATAWTVKDKGQFPASSTPPPEPTFVRVAPITVTQQGGSDQRVCLFTGEVEGGPLRPGVTKLAGPSRQVHRRASGRHASTVERAGGHVGPHEAGGGSVRAREGAGDGLAQRLPVPGVRRPDQEHGLVDGLIPPESSAHT